MRDTNKNEQARSQELRRSYAATARALSNAVEARDALLRVVDGPSEQGP